MNNKNESAEAVLINREMLEEINKYTRKEFSEKDLYVFSVILCDNEIDRDYEVFSYDTLKALKDMFVGKTGIFDHNPTSKNQTARIFKTELVTSDTLKTSYDKPFTYLKAYAYMIKTDKNLDLIKEIEGGIKKEVSVSCSVENVTCSICNKTKGECQHIKGKVYGKNTCFNILDKPTDAYEWSFVAIPAQRNAGVVKNFNLNISKGEQNLKIEDVVKKFDTKDDVFELKSEEVSLLKEYINELKEKSTLGEMYKKELEKEILSLNLFLEEKMNNSVLENILKKLSIDELKELKKSYTERSDKKQENSILSVETKSNNKKSQSNDFKI